MIIRYPHQAALEVSHSFREKSNFFTSYLVRTMLALVAPAVLLAFLSMSANVKQVYDNVIPCNVQGYKYECTGISIYLSMFAMIGGKSCTSCGNALSKYHLIYLSLSGVICLAFYLLCNIYNFLWLVISSMAKFSRVMSKFKGKTVNSGDLDELNRMYYNNRDFRLLLNLLWVVQNQIL